MCIPKNQGVQGPSPTTQSTVSLPQAMPEDNTGDTHATESKAFTSIRTKEIQKLVTFLNPFVDISKINFPAERDYTRGLQTQLMLLCELLLNELLRSNFVQRVDPDCFSVSVCLKRYNEKNIEGYSAPFAFKSTEEIDRPPSAFIQKTDPDNSAPRLHYKLSLSQRILDNTDCLPDDFPCVNEKYYYLTGKENILALFNSGFDNTSIPNRDMDYDARSQIIIYPILFANKRIGYLQLTAYRDCKLFDDTKGKFPPTLISLIESHINNIKSAIATELLHRITFDAKNRKITVKRSTVSQKIDNIKLIFSTDE